MKDICPTHRVVLIQSYTVVGKIKKRNYKHLEDICVELMDGWHINNPTVRRGVKSLQPFRDGCSRKHMELVGDAPTEI